MIIEFYTGFSKKTNSTKRPDNNTTKYTLTGTLKEPSSTMNPVVSIQNVPVADAPSVFTYASIPQFFRYYFIEDWAWVNGLWEVRMKVDVLATYRADIGNSTEYILRTDSTTDFNGDITDTTYPATNDIVSSTYGLTNIFTDDLTVGCYVVGIISGGQTRSVGAISYFAMTSNEFGVLKNALFSDDNLLTMGLAILDPSTGQLVPTGSDISLELLKTMYNPYQYIVSCTWFPFGKSALPSTTHVTGIKMGWWEYPNITGDRIYAETFELGNEVFEITAHPQASRGAYLNRSPYTRRTLVGRFGSVPLDSSFFSVGDKVNISYVIDVITGQCYAKISKRINNSNHEDLLTEKNFLLGVPIQLAQVGADYIGTASNGINTISDIMGGAMAGISGGAGGMVAGGIAGGISGIYNTIQTAMPQLETSGQNGSFLAPGNITRVVEQFYKVVDEDIAHRGRPLCETRQINTLSGYIMCAAGDINISCYDNERKEILRFLTEGFYWE